MNRRLFLFPIVLLLLAISSQMVLARTLNFEISVREKNQDGEFVLIQKKLLSLEEGIKQSSFTVNFTLDLTATYNDSGFFACEFSMFTLGPQTQTFFKKFQSQAGGIYFLENVRGKGDVIYRVGLSPLSVDSTDLDETSCDYDIRADGIWRFDPSAHFDFYYIPRSLGDARWNLLRDFVEINYKEFKEAFQFSFPGKINYFFSPCLVPELDWDQRMGYAIDPPRANCYGIYSHEHNTIDPFPAYLVRIYRYLGYAPPLLAEGMAAYFEYPHFYARSMSRDGALPPLSEMYKSNDYFRLPGIDNVSAASSFVKYLLDNYGYSQFSRLYREATDLNLSAKLEEIYEKPVVEIEKEWHQLLDSVTISFNLCRFFYEREKYVARETGMRRFMEAMHPMMASYEDSIYLISEESWMSYMNGSYVEGREGYETLIEMAPNNVNFLIIYANLLLIDGQYDSALVMYNRLLVTDSTQKTALYKSGETYYRMGEIDSAIVYLNRDIEEDDSQLSRASSGIIMGHIYLARNDTALATNYYRDALNEMEQIYQYGKNRPSFLMRLGESSLGLAMCGESSIAAARSYLETALYFEAHPQRVIFLSRTLRALGQAADLDGDRESAMIYYRQALDLPLPPNFERQIRSYVESPFAGYGR